MEMIEVNHVVLNVLDARDEIPDDPGVVGDLDPQSIFNSSHGADGVNRCSDPSYPLGHKPGPAWITPLQDDLQPAPHGAGTPRIGHLPTIYLGFDAQVSLNARDGIYGDFVSHLRSSLNVSHIPAKRADDGDR
jgi:hypothetical protein